MTSQPHARTGECQVVGAERLPVTLNTEIVCNAIVHSMASLAPGTHYKAEVQVLSQSRLSATLTVNGRELPRQNLAVSDGTLGEASVRRFADNLARLAVRK